MTSRVAPESWPVWRAASKSASIEITFDVIFDDEDIHQRVKSSGALDQAKVAKLYNVPPEEVIVCMFFDPAMAWKLTLRRAWAQGSVGERDTFGAAQHAPLLDIAVD